MSDPACRCLKHDDPCDNESTKKGTKLCEVCRSGNCTGDYHARPFGRWESSTKRDLERDLKVWRKQTARRIAKAKDHLEAIEEEASASGMHEHGRWGDIEDAIGEGKDALDDAASRIGGGA